MSYRSPVPAWQRWTAPIGVAVGVAHVMVAPSLDGFAAVAADLTTVIALGAVGLVLWRQRGTANQLWTEAQQIYRQWHEYHHQRLEELRGEQSALLAPLLLRIDEQVTTIRDRFDQLAGAQESSGPDLEVLVAIGRHLHALISRAVETVTTVERQVEDPDLLHEIFQVDHLLMLLRRSAARLAVLGGETARTVTLPVPLPTVLRQAAAEVEQYRRVTVELPTVDVALSGHVGPDVIHLLAELVENSTKFSPPSTQVVMRTLTSPAESASGAGLIIEIQDRGLPISPEKLAALNRLLASPEEVDVYELLKRGQIGLPVAALLARRHGIDIQLHSHGQGTQAYVTLPDSLLLPADKAAPQSSPAPAPSRTPNSAPAPLPRRRRNAVPPSSPEAPEPRPAVPTHLATQPAPRTGAVAEHIGGASAPGAEPEPDGRPPLPRRSDAQRNEHPAGDRAASVNPGLMANYLAGVRQARPSSSD